MTNYFPAEIPHGVVKDGSIYVPLSLYDRKLGIARRDLLLADESGLEIELSRSGSTLDWQRFNFGRSSGYVDEYRRTMIRTIMNDCAVTIDDAEIDALASQMILLKNAFSVDILQRKITDAEENEVRLRADVAKGAAPGYTFVDAYLHLLSPLSQKNISLSDVTSRSHAATKHEIEAIDRGYFVQHALKNSLAPLQHSVEAFYAQYSSGAKETKFPALTSDLVSRLLRTYANDAIIYCSWDEGDPMRVMIPSTEESERAIHIDGQRYVSVQKLSQIDFQLGLRLLTQCSVIADLPRQHMMSPIPELFPLQLANGVLTLEGHTAQVHANLRFPAYGVVDISSPAYVFLMPEGKMNFKYAFNELHELQLVDYAVRNTHDMSYYHFFTNDVHVCGFNDRRASAPLQDMSSMIWENYQLLLSVLTDDLKRDSGYRTIAGVRHHLRQISMVVDGHKFSSCYVPREKLEIYNRTAAQPLQIGDGRTN